MADEEFSAVLAHGLLGNLQVVSGVIGLLGSDRVAPEERARLIAMAMSQIDLMVDILRDMALGLPADVVEFLDQQRSQH